MPDRFDSEFGQEKVPSFVFPKFENETGEIERVARKFSPDDPLLFVHKFYDRARLAQLVELSDDVWNKLDNTDSTDITLNDWTMVAHNAEEGHVEHPRPWQLMKEKLETGGALDAPIIAKIGDIFHLVSGNTRLMVSRAAGIRPRVIVVDMN